MSKLSEENIKETIRLYESGIGTNTIADMFGVHYTSIWYHFRNNNIKMRPKIKKGKDNHFYRGGATRTNSVISMVNNAVKEGKLIRPKHCEKCGKSKIRKNGQTDIHGHHSDYNKTFEVLWLCKNCHFEWHKHNRAIKKL